MTEPSEEMLYLPLAGEPPTGEPACGPPSARGSGRRRPWRIAGSVLLVLAMTLGGALAWVFATRSAAQSDLSARLAAESTQLASATAEVAALTSQTEQLQSQLDDATRTGTDQTAQIQTLTKRIAALTTQLQGSLPVSGLPVVVYQGSASSKLKAQFQTQLVDVIQRYESGAGFPVVSMVITIPVNDGDPYQVLAVNSAGGVYQAPYGTKGSPLPAFVPVCPPPSDGCM